MRENNVCDLVICINIDFVENSNYETSIDKWNEKCRECYHSKNNPSAKKCNFERRREL